MTYYHNDGHFRAQKTLTAYDVRAVVDRLAVILRAPTSYKRFVACRGTAAQTLVNLLQDVSKRIHTNITRF